MAMHSRRLTAIWPARSELGVTHLAYAGMDLQALVDSREPTPAEIRRQSHPPSRANSIHSNVERETMPEQSFTAKERRPQGTRDDPFAIEDLNWSTELHDHKEREMTLLELSICAPIQTNERGAK